MARGKITQQMLKLVSSAGTGFFYTTSKPRKMQAKLAFRKYDPVVRQHVLFTEQKISRAKPGR